MTLAQGIIIAGTSSGVGKTSLTLGLIRALRDRDYRLAVAKSGPDFIDPIFLSHAASSSTDPIDHGRIEAFNLDGWAMRPEYLASIVNKLSEPLISHAHGDKSLLIAEGAMGLFDGTIGGEGSSADLAQKTGWPVLLIMDGRGQSASLAACTKGFSACGEVKIMGVIVNYIGSERHKILIQDGFKRHCPDIPLLGMIKRYPQLKLPSRHLGLVQADELEKLDGMIDDWAKVITDSIDIDRLYQLIIAQQPFHNQAQTKQQVSTISPLGQRIAIARDQAFSFIYPHLLDSWRIEGAELSFFSPLADESPDPTCDAIFLPGGYPEIFCEKISHANHFINDMKDKDCKGVFIYGECGGYMILGKTITDHQGKTWPMLGLLNHHSVMENRFQSLGYRSLLTLNETPLSRKSKRFRGHEFHYASVYDEDKEQPLFQQTNAEEENAQSCGTVKGQTLGSFIHLIDCAGSIEI